MRAEDPGARASSALTTTFDELFWQDDLRRRRLPTADDLASVDADRALAIYTSRFGDARGFDFVLVGDFNFADAERLARSYVGTLPTGSRTDRPKAAIPPPVSGVVRREVLAGSAPQAIVDIGFDVRIDVTTGVLDEAEALQAVLDRLIRQRIREQLGAAYSPSVTVVATRAENRIRTYITIAVDPAQADRVAVEVHGVIAGIRDGLTSQDDFDLALQPLIRGRGFVNYGELLESFHFMLDNPGVRYEQSPGTDPAALERLVTNDVAQLAQQVLPAEHYVEIIVLPEPAAG